MNRSIQKKITIFTPTYNRKDTLPRLYDSLCHQSEKPFEWLIVDDGSTDGTADLIGTFQREGKIPITFLKKQNGGKHTALNLGIQAASGTYFLCVDSDDFLEDGAIDTILEYVDTHHPDGIIAYKREFKKTGIIGDSFPIGIKKASLFDLINNYHCSGDRTLIFKTDLIRGIHIPEPKDAKFFPETYLYDCFDRKYQCDLLRKSICCCEYLDEGYSANFRMLMIRNAVSMKWFYAERIDFPCKLRHRYQFAYRYIAYSLLSKTTEGSYKGKHKLLLLAAIVPGFAMYCFYWFFRRTYR